MAKKLTEQAVRAIVASEFADSIAGMTASTLAADRSRSMDYYNGDMSRDMPSVEGRSSAVSTDVSDTIEGLMPSLMEIFMGGDEVVKFEPVGPEDEASAEQETDYVNHVFQQQNRGFHEMYCFIKDSLLQKNGIVKIYWENQEREEKETYYSLTDDQFAMIAADPEVEIIEHSAYDTPDEANARDMDEPVSAPG